MRSPARFCCGTEIVSRSPGRSTTIPSGSLSEMATSQSRNLFPHRANSLFPLGAGSYLRLRINPHSVQTGLRPRRRGWDAYRGTEARDPRPVLENFTCLTVTVKKKTLCTDLSPGAAPRRARRAAAFWATCPHLSPGPGGGLSERPLGFDRCIRLGGLLARP